VKSAGLPSESRDIELAERVGFGADAARAAANGKTPSTTRTSASE
jgi:hypothetical protein